MSWSLDGDSGDEFPPYYNQFGECAVFDSWDSPVDSSPSPMPSTITSPSSPVQASPAVIVDPVPLGCVGFPVFDSECDFLFSLAKVRPREDIGSPTAGEASMPRRPGRVSAKPNKVQKGSGPDAKKDPMDDYAYTEGHFHQVLVAAGLKGTSAKVIFGVCKRLVQVHEEDCLKLSRMNRWAKRRLANAYAWLDQNASLICEEEFLRICTGLRSVSIGE
jgi:hypothetical protein